MKYHILFFIFILFVSLPVIYSNKLTKHIETFNYNHPNNHIFSHKIPTYNNVVKGYDENDYLTHNQKYNLAPLQSSNFAQIYPNSKKSIIKPLYKGPNIWIKSFNDGLQLYKQKHKFNNGPEEYEIGMEPKYPNSVSTTGLFLNNMPRSYNISISN